MIFYTEVLLHEKNYFKAITRHFSFTVPIIQHPLQHMPKQTTPTQSILIRRCQDATMMGYFQKR